MTTNPPPSAPPSRVPGASGGGSTPFVLLAVVLVVVMGGLLCWKFKGTTDSAPATSATASATAAPPQVVDSPPPPPDDVVAIPDSSVAANKKGAPGTGSGAGSGCSSTCAGTASAGTRSDISGRAGNARGCYERALRVNSNLQGKLTVNLRVDSQGNICASSISGDSVGDGNVASCVLGMFRGARVSPPSGGCVDVSIPLNFQPKGK